MNYKILCSDLDGTLLSTKSDVSSFTISQIQRIKESTRIILVSARMPSGMIYIQERLGITDQPIICYNGALVRHGDKDISSVVIPVNLLQDLFELTTGFNAKLGLYYNDEWYVPNISERVEKEIKYTKTTPVFQETKTTLSHWEERQIGAHKIMLMCTPESADELIPKLANTFGEQLNLYRSNDTLIEVAPKVVSKLTAIHSLLNKGENLKDVIAFGDNYNDIEMLENVGCGVAVANGREEVKKISKYVALKNTEDGVAHFIKNHLVF